MDELSKSDFKFNLSDDILLNILKRLSMNERTNLRLVSSQFKRCVNKIQIQNLVIYEKMPCSSGVFELDNEPFSLIDTVCVYDLSKFFNCKPILKCLQQIKKLRILGQTEHPIDLKVNFQNLEHLELQKVVFKTSIILSSPKIKKIYIFKSMLAEIDQNRLIGTFYCKLTYSNYFGFDSLVTKIKHFRFFEHLTNDLTLYRYLVQKRTFIELETLELHLTEFVTVIYLILNLPKLKRFNFRFGFSKQDLNEAIVDGELNKLVLNLRNDLSVEFFHIPLNRSTVEDIKQFFQHFDDEIVFFHANLLLILNSKWNDFNRLFGNKRKLFSGFFNSVRVLNFCDQIEDKKFYKMFKNVNLTNYIFLSEDQFNLPDTFDLYPYVLGINFYLPIRTFYDNRILESLPKKCMQIQSLSIDNFKKVDLNFLTKLINLSILQLSLKFEIDQSLFLRLIKDLKHLAIFDVYFEKTDQISNDYLNSFKKSVLNYLNDLKIKNRKFKIEILRNNKHKVAICRYVMVRENHGVVTDLYDANEEQVERVFHLFGN